MPKSKILAEHAARPIGPYSQAIAAGNTIYISGQGGFDPASGKLMNATFEEEVTRTFENIKAILSAAGATMNNVVKVNVYLADLNNFARMNEIYKKYFREDYPARSTVGTSLLMGIQIEVDCVAVLDEK